MNSRIVCITGGSGAGKSTICYELVDTYPDKYEVINLDDYQKRKTEQNLPMIYGKINWDHPDIIDWKMLINDILTLKNGKSLTREVWSHRSNPDYAAHGQMVVRTIEPRPIILLEGYLALYNKDLNSIFDRKYYLDLDDETRRTRRAKNDVIGDPEYEEKVLWPMHKKYVEPTRSNADKIIDVTGKSILDISSLIDKDISKNLL